MTQPPNIKRADDELDAALQKRRAEAEGELQKRGWTLDGPRHTPSGFKASITKRNACVLVAGPTENELLDELLGHARETGAPECGLWLQRWKGAADERRECDRGGPAFEDLLRFVEVDAARESQS